MERNSLIIVFLILFGVISLKKVEALRCWYCSSDATASDFCADPFSEDKLVAHQKQYSYVECSKPNSPNVKAVCKKLKERVNGQLVVRRSCFFEDIHDSPYKCANVSRDSLPSDVKLVFCQTCTTDGCNTGTNFAPVATTLLLFILVAKMIIL